MNGAGALTVKATESPLLMGHSGRCQLLTRRRLHGHPICERLDLEGLGFQNREKCVSVVYELPVCLLGSCT